jgi:O-antigen ligase
MTSIFCHSPLTVLRRAYSGQPAWWLAFVAAMAMPWLLVVSRAGMDIAGGIIGLAFLWHSARSRDWQWTRTPLFRLSLLLWAWLVLVVTPLAYAPQESLVAALTFIRFPLMLMALICWVLVAPAARNLVAMSVLAVVVLVAVDVLWQYMTGVSLSGQPIPGGNRLTGPFDNPKAGLLMAKLLPPVLALAFVAAMQRGGWKSYLPAVAVMLGVMLTLVLTGDISATLGAGLALGVATLIVFWRLPNWRLPCTWVVIVGLALTVLLGLTQTSVQARFWRGYDGITGYEQSDYGVISQGAKEIAAAHSLHGVGIKNFRNLSHDIEYQGEPFAARHPHNFYLEWWVEAGIPGLLGFIALVLILLREALLNLRQASREQVILSGIALGMVVQHFFPLLGTQSFFNNWASMLIWFPLGLAFASLPGTQPWRRAA